MSLVWRAYWCWLQLYANKQAEISRGAEGVRQGSGVRGQKSRTSKLLFIHPDYREGGLCFFFCLCCCSFCLYGPLPPSLCLCLSLSLSLSLSLFFSFSLFLSLSF